jgi:hypothetical protein
VASGWDFLAGFATQLGGGLQARQEAKERDRLKKMEEDALMKRQMFLEEYRATVDQAAKEADYERTKNDVTAQFTNPETGEVFGRTKSGTTVPLSTTSDEYKQSLRDARSAELELKRARQEASEASAARSRRPPQPRAGGAEKEPKPPKPVTTNVRLESGGSIKARPADAIGPMAPLDPYGERPSLDAMPDNSAAGASPIFVDPSNPASKPLVKASRSISQPNAPTVEQILAEANKAVQAGVDPAKVEARMAQLMQQYGYTQ